MFRAHTDHLQTNFLDTVAQLAETKQRRLDNSWSGTFYRDVFCRIDETPFAVVYADDPSRPNTPVNISVGLELLKSGFNWSDEELFDHLNFDLQVRYALGIRDIQAEVCTLRTQYNFRNRISKRMQETGENLFARVFVQVTDEQLAALHLKTSHQRMDSTQVASNIRRYSRLQLLVEVVQRVVRMLSEEEQARYGDLLTPYTQGSAGQYCYRVKNSDLTEHLERIGQTMYRLLDELADRYGDEESYRLMQRVFVEHFDALSALPQVEPTSLVTSSSDTELGATVEVAVAPEAGVTLGAVRQMETVTVTPKASESLRADSLQSPDDLEATYREKNGQGHRGYVVNLSETCAPENDLQLITSVQVAPNAADDETLLVEALPGLQQRTPLDTLEVDGGYTGPDATRTCTQQGVTLNPSAIRGRAPDAARLGLDAFTWNTPLDDTPRVTCPNGQTAEVTRRRKPQRRQAAFDADLCAQCPLAVDCPTVKLKHRPLRVLNVSQRQIEVAQLRQCCARIQQADHHLRPAVESTVRSVKHPFGGRLPVRGQIRATMVILASVMMVNLRRIWRFEVAKQAKQRGQVADQEQDSFLSLLKNWIYWLIGAGQSPFRRRSALCCC